MINILVNIGTMCTAIYFYMRSETVFSDHDDSSLGYLIKCILFEVLVGMVLMKFSTVFMDIRYDLRVVLFSFSAKYLGWKITSSSILILALLRFLWGYDEIAVMNLFINIILAVALPLLVRYTRYRFTDRMQLLVLVTGVLAPAIWVTNQMIVDKTLVISISLVLLSSIYATVFVIHHFISDLSHLIALVNTDYLTSLKNVRTFNKELLDIERSKKSVTLAMIDIDYFKDYNDCFGHDSGDATLQQMAALFNDEKTTDTTFYRIGGEEFALIIEKTKPAEAEQFVHNLQETVENRTFYATTGEPINITISVGVAHSRSGEVLNKTLKRADKALYKAKRSGRNKVMIGHPQAQSNPLE